MHSIICFATFLFLLNLPPYWWFVIYSNNINGYKETLPFFAFTTIIAFALYIVCYTLYCYCVYENLKSLKSKNKIGFLWSLLILFIVLLLINIYIYIEAANAGGVGNIIMLAVTPVTILILISYLLYSALYFGILKIAKYLEKL